MNWLLVRIQKNPTPADVHQAGATWEPPMKRRRKKEAVPVEKTAATYVSRPVTTETDHRLRAWAKEYGLPALDQNLHVTIVHSSVAIPWTPTKSPLIIPPSNVTSIGKLGSEGGIVLFLKSMELRAQFRLARDAGAAWDFATYRPHLCLFYDPAFVVPTLGMPRFPLVLDGEQVTGALQKSGLDVTIVKVDEDQRLVYGFASVTKHPNGVEFLDTQNDVVDIGEIQQAAHRFISSSRALGEVHKRKDAGTVVESLVINDEVRKLLQIPAGIEEGWFIVAKVTDERVWQKVKNGEYQGFSIGGKAIREPEPH